MLYESEKKIKLLSSRDRTKKRKGAGIDEGLQRDPDSVDQKTMGVAGRNLSGLLFGSCAGSGTLGWYCNDKTVKEGGGEAIKLGGKGFGKRS